MIVYGVFNIIKYPGNGQVKKMRRKGQSYSRYRRIDYGIENTTDEK